MPSLNQDKSMEQSLTDGEVHASAAKKQEECGDDNSHSPVANSSDNLSGISSSSANNVTNDSTIEGNAKDNIKTDDEVNDSDVTTDDLEVERSGRAASAKKSSTNEEDDIISTKESYARVVNGPNVDEVSGNESQEQGRDAKTEDHSGKEDKGEYDYDTDALGKSNETSIHRVAELDSDSNHTQVVQYSQSFISSSTQSQQTFTRSSRNEKQDEYVKKGARVKALLATALQAVADGLAARDATVVNRNSNGGDEIDTDGSNARKMDADFVHVQDLAQKKSEECITLKRQLEECQLQIQCLHNECAASEQNAGQIQSKIDRTLEALKIAGANAANARAEADAANARAESLNGQLNDLQAVIEDTKNNMEIVRREHDEVSHAARSVESRLIQVESELTRAARVKRDAEEERDALKVRAEKSEKLVSVLQDKVNDYQDEIRHLKKDMVEMDELEKMRSDRMQRIEAELQDARAGLLEATSAAAEAESTVTSLRSVIEELRRENESLHFQIDESRNAISKERTKQNEVLTLAEKEAQKWRMKCEENEEENRKLKMDKATAEKQVEQLKGRITNLERRINDSAKGHLKTGVATSAAHNAVASDKTAVVTPKNTSDLGVINSFGSKEAISDTAAEEGNKRKYVSELPVREQPKNPSASDSYSRQLTYSSTKPHSEKENRSNKSDSQSRDNKRPKKIQPNICCLCNREGGMILRCQCDNVNCDKRGHPLCIGKFRLGKADSAKTILCSKA